MLPTQEFRSSRQADHGNVTAVTEAAPAEA